MGGRKHKIQETHGSRTAKRRAKHRAAPPAERHEVTAIEMSGKRQVYDRRMPQKRERERVREKSQGEQIVVTCRKYGYRRCKRNEATTGKWRLRRGQGITRLVQSVRSIRALSSRVVAVSRRREPVHQIICLVFELRTSRAEHPNRKIKHLRKPPGGGTLTSLERSPGGGTFRPLPSCWVECGPADRER